MSWRFYELWSRHHIQTRHSSPINAFMAKYHCQDYIKHKDIDLSGIITLSSRYPDHTFVLDNLWEKPYLSWEEILYIHDHIPNVSVRFTLEEICSNPYTPIDFLREKGLHHPSASRHPEAGYHYYFDHKDKEWNPEAWAKNPSLNPQIAVTIYTTELSELISKNPALKLDDLLKIEDLYLPLICRNPNIMPDNLDKLKDAIDAKYEDEPFCSLMMNCNPNIIMDHFVHYEELSGEDIINIAHMDYDVNYALASYKSGWDWTNHKYQRWFCVEASQKNFLANLDKISEPIDLLASPYITVEIAEKFIGDASVCFYKCNEHLSWTLFVPFRNNENKYNSIVRREIFTLLLVLQRCASYIPPELTEMIINFIIVKNKTSYQTMERVLSLVQES